MRRSSPHLGFLEVVICFWLLVAFAFPGPAWQQIVPRFDPMTVVTVLGSVQSVEEHRCPLAGERAVPWMGTHALLRTAYGNLDVHFGPSSFLKMHHFSVVPGDELQVTGSKFAGELPVTLIASEVKKGRVFLELRDRNGEPLWKEAFQK